MDELDVDNMTWPQLQRLCYLIGFGQLMENISHEQRMQVFALRQRHFDQSNGAPMKQLSRKVWEEARGRSR